MLGFAGAGVSGVALDIGYVSANCSNMQLRRAEPNDAPALTAIAFAAKRHWGYPEAWIQRRSAPRTITADYIAANPCFAASDERGRKLGLAALRNKAGEFWSGHLWDWPA